MLLLKVQFRKGNFVVITCDGSKCWIFRRKRRCSWSDANQLVENILYELHNWELTLVIIWVFQNFFRFLTVSNGITMRMCTSQIAYVEHSYTAFSCHSYIGKYPNQCNDGHRNENIEFAFGEDPLESILYGNVLFDFFFILEYSLAKRVRRLYSVEFITSNCVVVKGSVSKRLYCGYHMWWKKRSVGFLDVKGVVD